MNTDEEIISKLANLFLSKARKKDGRMKASDIEIIAILVFIFAGDNKQDSISGIYRAFIKFASESINRGSFWERLAGNPLRKTLENIVAALIADTIGVAVETTQILSLLKITGIYLLDATSILLPDEAEKHFRGTSNKAGIKQHCAIELFSGKTIWYKLFESRSHDHNHFPPFELLTGALIIFDLGYFDYQLMLDLMSANIYFLCRLKTNSVVFIEEVVKGFDKSHIGKSLLTCRDLTKCKGNILEAIVQKTTRNGGVMKCRAIGFWNPDTKCYHWYLCNLKVAAQLIYPLYRLRWQIELTFKACKNSLHIDSISSANPNIIQALILAGIAAQLSSQAIHEVALNTLTVEKRCAITVQRLAYALVILKDLFSNCIVNPIQENIDRLVRGIHKIKNELYDPNYKKRKTSKAQFRELLLEIITECT